jgi:hypothetical protein
MLIGDGKYEKMLNDNGVSETKGRSYLSSNLLDKVVSINDISFAKQAHQYC